MNQFIALFLTAIVVVNNLRISQATLYTYANNVKEDHIPQAAASASAQTAAASNYFKVNTDAAIANKENNQQQQNTFHNIQKSVLNQDSTVNYQMYDDIQAVYHPSKLYTSVDYNVEHDNDVDDAYNKEQAQLQQLAQYQYQQVPDMYEFSQQEKPSLLIKQLQSQHQDLSEGYAAFLHEPYQVVAPPKAESGSSNDYQHHQQQQQQYATPAPPPKAKMHLNLHHHQLNNNYNNNNNENKPTIVSYATGGNEALPSTSTTTSIKSQNMPQYGVKYVTDNELNTYDNENTNKFARQPALVYGQPGSQQYVYAPMRSSFESELPFSSKTLPYPPSFISFTTTEKPSNNYYTSNHKSVYNRIPDLFSHRQSKSLLDSYIPSWQVTKMFQQKWGKQGNQNNHLHTLAFVLPYKNYYKREVNKGRKIAAF